MVRIYVTLTILILTIANVAAQHIDTMTGVFNDNFKSLTIHLDGNQFAPPIIFLGSDDHLIINFDELAVNDFSMTAAKEKGLVRLEGKEYVMKDGDIVNFLFNV